MGQAERTTGLAETRLVAAFLLLPVVNSLVTFLGMWILVATGAYGYADPVGAATSLAGGIAIATVFVGAPCGVAFVCTAISRRRLMTFKQLALTGCLVGYVPLAIVFLLAAVNQAERPPMPFADPFETQRLAFAIFLGPLMGLLSASTLWFVGLRGGPFARPPVSLA